MSSITIVEKVQENSFSQEYSCFSEKRAFQPYGNVIYAMEDGKDIRVFTGEGKDGPHWAAGVAKYLQENGYLLSKNLHARMQRILAEIEAGEAEYQQKKLKAQQQARLTGLPQVVSSCDYQTTASVGTNFYLAMPDGSFETVTNGCPTGSHSTKDGTTNSTSPVQDAIWRYLKS